MKHLLFSLSFLFLLNGPAFGQMVGHVELAGDKPEDVFLRLIRDGDLEGVQLFLGKFDLPLELNSEYLERFFYASFAFRQEEVCLELIEAVHRANPKDANKFFASEMGSNILDESIAARLPNAFCALWDAGARHDDSRYALKYKNILRTDDLDFIQQMQGRGVPPSEWSKDIFRREYPPVLRAAWAGAPRILSYLLDQGADPNSKLEKGLSLTSVAAASGSEELLRIVLSRGGNQKMTEGKLSALSYAASTGNVDSVRLLLEQGLNKGLALQTSAYIAMSFGNPEVVAALKSAGVEWDGVSVVPARGDRTDLGPENEYEVSDRIQASPEEWVRQRTQSQLPSERLGDQTVALFTDEASRDLGAVLLAEMSDVQGVDFVERSKIDAILREQSLSTNNPYTDVFSKALALVPADMALVVRSQPSNAQTKQERIALFHCEWIDLTSGIVLGSWLIQGDVLGGEGNLQRVLAAIGNKLTSRATVEAKQYIRLNRFRPNDTLQQSFFMANEFNLLLRSKLVTLGYRVVDHEGRSDVLFEQLLGNEGDFEQGLQAWSIEGGLGQSENDAVYCRLRIEAAGNEPRDIRIEADSSVQLLEKVTAWIQEHTKMPPPNGFSPSDEANELLHQAALAQDMGFYQQSIRLTDSAWALVPEEGNLLWKRLNIRMAYLKDIMGAFNRERGSKGIRLLGQKSEYGYYKDLDPLSWFDVGLSEEELLSMLDESYQLMCQLLPSGGSRYQKHSHAEGIQNGLELCTSFFTWFTPLHLQEKYTLPIGRVKESGRAAYRMYMDALPTPNPEKPRVYSSQRIIDEQMVQHWAYFFDATEIIELLEFYTVFCADWNVPLFHPQFSETQNHSTYAVLGHHPRPNYPRGTWKQVIQAFEGSSVESERTLAEILALSFKPKGEMLAWLGDWFERKANGDLKPYEHDVIGGFVLNTGWHLGITNKHESWHNEEFLHAGLRRSYLNNVDPTRRYGYSRVTQYPGYAFMDKLHAEKVVAHYKGLEDQDSSAEALLAAKKYLSSLEPIAAKGEVELKDISPKNIIVLKDVVKAIPTAFEVRFRGHPLKTNEHILFMLKVTENTGDSYSLLYRLNLNDLSLEQLALHEDFEKGKRVGRVGTVGFAENPEYLIINRTRYSERFPGAVYVLEKKTGQWTVLEGFEGGGDACVHALGEDFLLLVAPTSLEGPQRKKTQENRRQIIRYHPRKNEVTLIADNFRVPEVYPFERPGYLMKEIFLSEDKLSFAVTLRKPNTYAVKDRNTRGRVSLVTGEWIHEGNWGRRNTPKGRVMTYRDTYRPEILGHDMIATDTKSSLDFVYVTKTAEGRSYLQFALDQAALEQVLKQQGVTSASQAVILNELNEHNWNSALLMTPDLLMRFSKTTLMFFEPSEVESRLQGILERGSYTLTNPAPRP